MKLKNILFVVLLFLLMESLAMGTLYTGTVSGTNGIIYSFEDTPLKATITLSGTQIMQDEIISLYTVGGEFWNWQLALVLDDDIDDEIYLTSILQHKHLEHPPQDKTIGTQFSTSLTALAEDAIVGTPLMIPGSSVLFPHGDHTDRFYNNKLTINIDTTFPDIDDIMTWSYTIVGEHTPEPATICLLGLGGLILRRRKV